MRVGLHFCDFYCVLLYIVYLFCLSVCLSLCVCVWAMLPDSSKIMTVLQASVATRKRCGGIFNNSFTANFPENLPVKSLKIGKGLLKLLP